MNATKKQIIENTIVKKAKGFNPYYSFSCTIKAGEFTYKFSRGMAEIGVYVIVDNSTHRVFEGEAGYAEYKKEFIQVAYDYVNA